MSEARAVPRLRWSDLDPLRLLWRGLTSVRFALGLIGFLAIASLMGAVIPQMPIEMRGNPAFEAQWLAMQDERFGFLTEPMDRLGLFQLFRSLWFTSGLALLVASVVVCTANRLPPIWRNVFQPQVRVPDEYLTRSEAAIAVEAPDADALTGELKRRRYKVRTAVEGDSTYVFTDRYPWAQFATFVSHLALILFLAGAFVTVVAAKEAQVLVAEGERPFPVFSVADPDHMQIYVEEAVGLFDQTGFPLDFRSHLVIYKDGEEVARGVTTVNQPLRYDGYRFHQSAFFPDGVALQVRDAATGRLVYDEVLPLFSTAATPRLIIRDGSGSILVDDLIVPTDYIGDTAGTLIGLPGSERLFWVGARPSAGEEGWQLVVFEMGNDAGVRETIAEGGRLSAGGLSFSFIGMVNIPSSTVRDVPGMEDEGVIEFSTGSQGPQLTLGPIGGRALALSPDEPFVLDGYEYTFAGQREFTGITVRRDPGSNLIWVATGVFLLGLALTFYTPRRRLWGKITAGQAHFRGLGGQRLRVEKEVREVAARARRG